jgi:hypothetical protein
VYDPSPIEIVAPAPRKRFASPQAAIAYYNAFGVQSREDVIVLAELALAELKKINEIWSGVIQKLEADRQAELAAAQE